MKATTNTIGNAAKAVFITLKKLTPNRIAIILILLGFGLGGCASQQACGPRGRQYPPQPFNMGGGEFVRGNGGSGVNRVLALDIHVDHQSRPVSDSERQSYFRGMWDRGASQEETEEGFRQRFSSPNATFIFRNGWSPRGHNSYRDQDGDRGDRGSSSSSDDRVELDKDGFPKNGGAMKTSYQRVAPADNEPVSHASNRQYRQPTQLERDDTAFWAEMPDGAGTGQFKYPPSTLEKSRKVRALADRDEARFSRD